jgi:hypothetical protein
MLATGFAAVLFGACVFNSIWQPARKQLAARDLSDYGDEARV